MTNDANDMWPTIGTLTTWLDTANGTGPEELALRFLKLTEEVGEASAALIGLRGQNPRKGITHTTDDVAGELCDVIVTAAVALTTLLGSSDAAREHMAGKLQRIVARSATAAREQPAP